MRFGPIAAILAFSVSTMPGIAASQTLNQGFKAMEQGDFLTAFSALRRLEQAGDPDAARLLNEIFLTPTPAPVATQPSQVAAPARPEPVIRHAAPPAPTRSLRPQPRITPVAMPSAHAPETIRHELPPPLNDASFRPVDPQLADIGHLLFFDPILSGNKDISCAVCHHPSLGSGDGVSLGLGTGATGLGEARLPLGEFAANRRIPRNAPALWNLGAREIRVLFHDGRVEIDPAHPGGLLTPQGPLDYMEFHSILAAQAMFPVLSQEEMAGRPEENPIATAVYEDRIHGDDGAWALIAARVDAIAEYRAAFAAWRGADRKVQMNDIANAIAAFIEAEFRADQSPFDAYLRETAALSAEAGEGMRLFFGRANCASCHSGSLLSDQQFHAMGQPPIGPGKDRDDRGYTRDIGRGGVSLDPEDDFAFRTPMLRNVMQTGPWGHAGAFSDIRDFLRHHIDPVTGLARYAPQAILPALTPEEADYAAVENAVQMARISDAAARSMAQRPLVLLQDDEIDLLVTFLGSLTDETSLEGPRGVPRAVPSGLRVER
ncbi:MAG: cytochrome c peroxidase [Roseinatronobacter sp.]